MKKILAESNIITEKELFISLTTLIVLIISTIYKPHNAKNSKRQKSNYIKKFIKIFKFLRGLSLNKNVHKKTDDIKSDIRIEKAIIIDL